MSLSDHTPGAAGTDLASPNGFTANQIHGRVYAVIREAAERLSQRSGWKRHIPWLVSSLGAALNVAHAFLYKNYPDKDDLLTAVRLYRWSNPLHRSLEHLSEPRVSRYEGAYLGYLRDELFERRSVLCTSRNPLPPLREYMESNGVDRVVIVPIFAGDEWWGFVGIEDSAMVPSGSTEPIALAAINDILRTTATVIGEAIRGAGLDQALRWSERLQRIQRDIALTVTRRSDRRGALNELLALICELGEFDAAAIDLQADEALRVASIGDTPSGGVDGWCDSCRPSFPATGEDVVPVYGDSTMLEFCGRNCPVHASGFHSYAAVPIVYEGSAAATMSLFSSRRSTVPTAVRASIEAIGIEIGMIIATVLAEEERLRSKLLAGELEKRHALAMEAGQVGVWEYLPEKRAFFVDKSLLDLIGIEIASREVPEDVALDYFELDDRVELLDRLHSGPEHWTGTFDRKLKLKSGSGRWFGVRSRASTVPDGGTRLVGTAVDISYLEKYQESVPGA